MFATTFLGHQGWLFSTERSCVLVDPLLREEFGQAHALEYRVYPPREMRLEAFPAIDAVVLTHEHDDHFDVPSLARLDRGIPIYLSARSSTAGFRILSEMGFVVERLIPGVALTCDELELYPLVGDHTLSDNGDEWDTLPFAIKDRHGHGSFFSSVDVTVTRSLLEGARNWTRHPGVVAWTNNMLDRSHMLNAAPAGDASQQFSEHVQAGLSLLKRVWGVPAAMPLCGGGFSFYGSRSWLNSRLFCVDPDEVCAKVARANATVPCLATRPGQTLTMIRGALTAVTDATPFLGTAPIDTWPSRAQDSRVAARDYEPAVGRRDISAQEVELLRLKLQDFADALAGSQLFRELYSLIDVELFPCRPTFALVLRHGERAGVFEYNPNACGFDISRTEHPTKAYVAGLTCWATDLLAVLSGELSPIALSFGRASVWNQRPDRLEFNVFRELYRLSHPLRRPNAYHAIYRKQLEACRDVEPALRRHSSS